MDNHEAHEAAWMAWGERHGRPIDHAFYSEHLYARSNDRILRTLLGETLSDHDIRRWAREKEALYREIYRSRLTEMPGLRRLLEELRAGGLKLAVASNAERLNVDFVVDGLGIRSFFGAVLAREDVRHGKPDPELFLCAAQQLGVAPGQCLILEDSATGFEAARRAGIPCVAITGHTRAAVIPDHVRDVHRDFSTVSLRDLARL